MRTVEYWSGACHSSGPFVIWTKECTNTQTHINMLLALVSEFQQELNVKYVIHKLSMFSLMSFQSHYNPFSHLVGLIFSPHKYNNVSPNMHRKVPLQNIFRKEHFNSAARDGDRELGISAICRSGER